MSELRKAVVVLLVGVIGIAIIRPDLLWATLLAAFNGCEAAIVYEIALAKMKNARLDQEYSFGASVIAPDKSYGLTVWEVGFFKKESRPYSGCPCAIEPSSELVVSVDPKSGLVKIEGEQASALHRVVFRQLNRLNINDSPVKASK